MKINHLSMHNFRIHLDTELDFVPNINVIWGHNGDGKTSVLEAISVCSISASFVTHNDQSLINKDEKRCSVTADCTNELNVPYKISVSYTKNKPKQISSTLGNKLLPKDIIGEMPLVVLSPDNKNITSGSPDFRRQFVNSLLSQASKFYLNKLYEARRIIKQRNILLKNISQMHNEIDRNANLPLLEQWTDVLINANAEIIIRRELLMQAFRPLFVEAYHTISNSKEEVDIRYVPDSINEKVDFNSPDATEQIKGELHKRAAALQNVEMKLGSTTFGYQKDDFRITINGGIAKDFASQGQHKSLLIALKFAEFNYLLDKNQEIPIILFDDIFSELDALRIEQVIKLLSDSNAQIFITLTEPHLLDVSDLPKHLINISEYTTIRS
jgi:DNA replication and repair protein RecF